MFVHENQTPVPPNSHLTYAEVGRRATLKVKVQAEVEGLTSQVEDEVKGEKKAKTKAEVQVQTLHGQRFIPLVCIVTLTSPGTTSLLKEALRNSTLTGSPSSP